MIIYIRQPLFVTKGKRKRMKWIKKNYNGDIQAFYSETLKGQRKIEKKYFEYQRSCKYVKQQMPKAIFLVTSGLEKHVKSE